MNGAPEEEDAAARRRDGGGAPDDAPERPERTDDVGDGATLPDWRDAHLPRYQGGTHARVGQPAAEIPPGLIIRGLSVVPFVVLGLLAFLGAVSLLLIVVFGSGSGQSIVSWMRGRSGGQIAAGILELVGLELGCGAVMLVSWLAIQYGFKEQARAWFWVVATAIGAAGTALVIAVSAAGARSYGSVSVSGHNWLVALPLFVLMTVASALRLRRRRRSGHVDEA
jgi:hypothetical protein